MYLMRFICPIFYIDLYICVCVAGGSSGSDALRRKQRQEQQVLDKEDSYIYASSHWSEKKLSDMKVLV